MPEWMPTPKELERIDAETNKRGRDLAQSTEGHFTQADMDTVYQDGRGAIIQATLRHIYEEGEKICPHRLKARECDQCWAELKAEAGL